MLQEYPFNKKGGVVNLFKDKIDVVKEIVSTIDKVNDRFDDFTVT